jgi:hypothetical protein
MYKFTFILFAFLASTAFATPVEVNCTYTDLRNGSTGLSIHPGSSTFNSEFRGSSGLISFGNSFDSVPSDLSASAQAFAKQTGMPGDEGYIYALSRADRVLEKGSQPNIIVEVYVANASQGQITNGHSERWNFGLADGFLVMNSPKTLGKITCRAEKK